MSSLLRDFAYGARSLWKSPGFTATALVTLALGIGASTAIFSVVNAVLLRPLPYADPDALVIITSDLAARNVNDFPIAPADVKDMRDEGQRFSGMAGLITFKLPFTDEDGRAQQIQGANVTTNLFSLLGAGVVAGRDFTDADGTPQQAPAGPPAAGPGTAPAAPPVPPTAILSYGFWQRQYGGDRGVIGKLITLGARQALVVGVAPRGFELLFPPSFHVERTPDVYLAARVDWSTASRINVVFRMVGRLKPGVTLGAAQQQMDAIAADLKQRFPIKATAGLRLRVAPMHQELVADVRSAVLALMGGVTFVLLIACANVANLLLVRTSRRERDLAVRAALGGNRLRLVRQMLSEALILSAGGAALGLGLAELGVRLLVVLGPADLPTVGRVAIDTSVLGFTVAACMVAAAAFGVLPALRASRPDVVRVLRSSGRTAELGGGRALRNGVVTAEVALAFVLLVGSGLMLRSFVVLTRARPGFDAGGLLTFTARSPRPRNPDELAAFTRELQQRLEAMPGVSAVTGTSTVPLSGQETNVRWGTETAVNDPAAFQQADAAAVLPGYFAAMHTRVIAGRTFTDEDDVPTSTSVVIDRVLAAKAFPRQSAVGKRLYVRYRSDEPEWVDIIGVVDQQRRTTPASDGREQMYFTNGQFQYAAVDTWLVRTSGDPARLEATVRAAVHQVDPTILVADMKPMSTYVDAARGPTRFALTLIGTFAAIALVLAAVGLYGVLSTVVRQRTAEIGVRMALGASKQRVFRQMVGEGVRPSLFGIGVGVLAALALTRSMRGMLVGVAPTDPATFVAIALLFLGIAVVSCWLPASRASALDPAGALREE
jgi:putative ABC transport system permease protein